MLRKALLMCILSFSSIFVYASESAESSIKDEKIEEVQKEKKVNNLESLSREEVDQNIQRLRERLEGLKKNEDQNSQEKENIQKERAKGENSISSQALPTWESVVKDFKIKKQLKYLKKKKEEDIRDLSYYSIKNLKRINEINSEIEKLNDDEAVVPKKLLRDKHIPLLMLVDPHDHDKEIEGLLRTLRFFVFESSWKPLILLDKSMSLSENS